MMVILVHAHVGCVNFGGKTGKITIWKKSSEKTLHFHVKRAGKIIKKILKDL